MFYYTTSQRIKKIVSELFNKDIHIEDRVNFSVNYSQNRSLSIITIEVTRTPSMLALMFIYTSSFSLYDVICYNHKQILRLSHDTKTLKLINELNKFIYSNISRNDTTTQRKIKEENLTAEILNSDDARYKIQLLRDRNDILKAENKRLRDLVKQLRKKH